MKRTNVDDYQYLKLLLYGEPGSGKTRASASAALDERTSPVLMLDSGGNPISIRSYAKKPDIVTCDELADFNQPYEWLAAGQPTNHVFCTTYKLNPPYKTVIIDGVTEVQRMSFRLVTNNQRTGPGTLPSTAELQHFNRVLGQMVAFARLYFALPMHVIVTSLERSDKDEVTGAMMLKPLLWGQSSSEVAGYAFAVGRMVHRARLDGRIKQDAEAYRKLGIVEDSIDESTTSVALWTPTGKYVAKDQYGALGPYMTDPTITKIFDRIYGGEPNLPTKP